MIEMSQYTSSWLLSASYGEGSSYDKEPAEMRDEGMIKVGDMWLNEDQLPPGMRKNHFTQGLRNKLAKLRRCASQVHFKKYSLEYYSLEKYSLERRISDGGDLLGDGSNLLKGNTS